MLFAKAGQVVYLYTIFAVILGEIVTVSPENYYIIPTSIQFTVPSCSFYYCEKYYWLDPSWSKCSCFGIQTRTFIERKFNICGGWIQYFHTAFQQCSPSPNNQSGTIFENTILIALKQSQVITFSLRL